MRLVVLGGGESGVGTAILGKQKGYDVFVSDFGKIKDNYKEVLNHNAIAWEDETHSESLILKSSCTLLLIPLSKPAFSLICCEFCGLTNSW